MLSTRTSAEACKAVLALASDKDRLTFGKRELY
jgi:hypothetical protein